MWPCAATVLSFLSLLHKYPTVDRAEVSSHLQAGAVTHGAAGSHRKHT